ncbi:hypothetical protein RHSIM_Rhsim01G0231900 [Rhododendron simsii]|uniref:IMP dehydrogenase/GMP reductase domain-containing protein n=1 Tax=Rhododendron simsii TaxID=118357 RepID=A0A834HJU9_RHOSS|nr:hypothetical protein RHSIM_Rhsim01G0231900 [Rhododendron simsii]
MGSLEAMMKGSDARYLGDTAKLKIAQGVVGAVADKGSVLKFLPYNMQAVKQGFQDLAISVHSGAAQVEGGVHGLVFLMKRNHFDIWSPYVWNSKLEKPYQIQ